MDDQRKLFELPAVERGSAAQMAGFPLISLPDPLVSTLLLNLRSLEDLRPLLQVSHRFRPYVLEAIRMLPTLDFTEGCDVTPQQFTRFVHCLLVDNYMDVRPLSIVTTVDLSGCLNLSKANVLDLLRHCPQCEHLYISKTGIKENETAELAYATPRPLKTLHLGKWTKLHEASTCAAKFQEALPQLGLRQEYEGAGVCDDGGEYDGIYIDVADQKGLTPLLIGCYNGVTSVVRFWLEQGANIEAADCFGVNGLMKAAYLGHLPIVTLLLERGTDTSKQDMYGASALAKAAYRDNTDVVKCLIQHKADFEAKDMFGNRPLMAAAAAASSGAISLLLAAGASVNAADNSNRTALTRALDAGNTTVVATLRNHGAQEETDANSSVPMDTGPCS